MNAASSSLAPKRPLSILLADDEKDTVQTLSLLLHDAGHVVHQMYNGGMVLDAVRRYKPDVCILDIQMPGMNGYDLAAAITREFKAAAPMLIAISAKWTTEADKHVAKAVGFRHFLLKPAHPDDLLRILGAYTPPKAA